MFFLNNYKIRALCQNVFAPEGLRNSLYNLHAILLCGLEMVA